MGEADITEKRPNGGLLPSRVKDLEEDVYGVERRDQPGIINRLKKVEEGVEDWLKAKAWIKAFGIGLGVNIIGVLAVLIFLWDIARKLATLSP